MFKAKKNTNQSQAFKLLSNLVKPHRSDKLEGGQTEFIQSFDESTYEMLHYVIKFKFIFIMAVSQYMLSHDLL